MLRERQVKLKQSMSEKSTYLILLVLFVGSFFIYSYNLDGQPWHGDEITYLGWGGNYFHLVVTGNWNNSCLKSLDHCNLLFHIPAFGLTYSPIRNIIIGLSMYLTNQDDGNFYNWSCYWDCYNHSEGPTIQEMTAGRLFSPVFGSLSVVLSFLIGKILFNKYVGAVASLFLLFYDLWIWYSRTIMVEVHYIFFTLVSLLLLLHSLKTERTKIIFFILSAVTFGIALNSKMLTVTFSILFLGIIISKRLFYENSGFIFKKKHVVKTILLAFSFFAISLLGLFLAEPDFYENPIHEIQIMKTDMDNYNHAVWYIGYPTIQNVQIKSIVSMFHYVVFPSFMEKQISSRDLNLNGNFAQILPPTYSSVPLGIFFFAGLGSIIYRISKSKNCASEALLLIWFASTFIFTLVIVKDFSLERYLLPLEISVIFISSYGLWNFVREISNNKTKVFFVILAISVHSFTALYYWEKIYFSPGIIWTNPLHYGTLQESFDNSFTFVADMLFIVCLFFILAFQFQKRRRIMTFVSEKVNQFGKALYLKR